MQTFCVFSYSQIIQIEKIITFAAIINYLTKQINMKIVKLFAGVALMLGVVACGSSEPKEEVKEEVKVEETMPAEAPAEEMATEEMTDSTATEMEAETTEEHGH